MLERHSARIDPRSNRLISAGSAPAQWFYPIGYGRYGWGGWGSDPAAGLMAGLGSYARGKGAYELDKAKADAINAKTAIAWNKANSGARLGFFLAMAQSPPGCVGQRTPW